MGSQVQEGKRPRTGAFRRPLKCLAVGGASCIYALHVAAVEITIADGISRSNPEDIDGNLHVFRPDVAWHRKVLSTADATIFSILLSAYPPFGCAIVSSGVYTNIMRGENTSVVKWFSKSKGGNNVDPERPCVFQKVWRYVSDGELTSCAFLWWSTP